MKLGFGHRAFQAEEQTVIEMPRIVDTIFVEDKRIAEGAEFNQAMPVAAGTSQARDLDADDGARAAETDFADQALEADATMRGFAGAAEVVVDNEHLSFRPAELVGTLDQRILPLGTFFVAQDLLQGRLADVHIGIALQMGRRDFRVSDCRQHWAPPVSC